MREVAAYLMDHDSFADVPMTSLAEARHPAFHCNGSMLTLNQGGASVGRHSLGSLVISPSSYDSCRKQPPKKVGSCQEFVNAECTMDDLSPSKISVDELHKIAVLDIRLMNADRNTANLLCRRNPEDPDHIELIPIDHGYCLRTVADVCWFDWCWLDWGQRLGVWLTEPGHDFPSGQLFGGQRGLQFAFVIASGDLPLERCRFRQRLPPLVHQGVDFLLAFFTKSQMPANVGAAQRDHAAASQMQLAQLRVLPVG